MPLNRKPLTDGQDSLWLLSDISPHDKPWDIHRASADLVRRLYQDIGYDRYAERIEDCSKWLEFALRTAETGEMTPKLFAARFCRVRHCPVCQWRKSLMWRARFLKVMPKVIADHPSARYVFLTLTVRNCPVQDLKQTVMAMNAAWHRLIKRKQFPAVGFVRSLEVTRNSQDNTAHPHFHCLLMVKPSYFSTGYLSQLAWTDLWQDCLKVDYKPVVNIKAVKGKKGKQSEGTDSLIPAICETLKYSVKEADLVVDAVWLQEITKQLHKTRSIAVGGILKQYLSEDEPEDLIHGDDEPDDSLEDAPKLIFDWSAIIKKYHKR